MPIHHKVAIGHLMQAWVRFALQCFSCLCSVPPSGLISKMQNAGSGSGSGTYSRGSPVCYYAVHVHKHLILTRGELGWQNVAGVAITKCIPYMVKLFINIALTILMLVHIISVRGPYTYTCVGLQCRHVCPVLLPQTRGSLPLGTSHRGSHKVQYIRALLGGCVRLTEIMWDCETVWDWQRLCETMWDWQRLCETDRDYVRLCETVWDRLRPVETDSDCVRLI